MTSTTTRTDKADDCTASGWQRFLASPLGLPQWRSTPMPWQIPACAVFSAFVWALSGWAPLVLITGIVGTGVLGVVLNHQKRRADR